MPQKIKCSNCGMWVFRLNKGGCRFCNPPECQKTQPVVKAITYAERKEKEFQRTGHSVYSKDYKY